MSGGGVCSINDFWGAVRKKLRNEVKDCNEALAAAKKKKRDLSKQQQEAANAVQAAKQSEAPQPPPDTSVVERKIGVLQTKLVELKSGRKTLKQETSDRKGAAHVTALTKLARLQADSASFDQLALALREFAANLPSFKKEDEQAQRLLTEIKSHEELLDPLSSELAELKERHKVYEQACQNAADHLEMSLAQQHQLETEVRATERTIEALAGKLALKESELEQAITAAEEENNRRSKFMRYAPSGFDSEVKAPVPPTSRAPPHPVVPNPPATSSHTYVPLSPIKRAELEGAADLASIEELSSLFNA